MASHPKSKKLLLAPIFLEGPTKSSPIHIEHAHYSPLNSNNWLGTSLIDYLIQRFITPSCIEENTVIPSSEFMDRMAFQMKKLNSNERGHKASVRKTRMNFMFFRQINLELLLPLLSMDIFLYYRSLSMQQIVTYSKKFLFMIVYEVQVVGRRSALLL
jgi:hypothetical protein